MATKVFISHQNKDLKFFEFGSTYIKTNAPDFEDKYVQKYILGITLTGLTEKVNWNTPEKQADFYTLKAKAETILSTIGLQVSKLKISDLEDKTFKYGLEYKMGRNHVMKIGAIGGKMLKAFDIDQDVFFAEIDWEFVFDKTPKVKSIDEIVKFHKVKRDLALLLDDKIKYAEIKKIGYETDKKLIKEVNIFDVYQGDKISSGKKSYAVSFMLQDENKTLTDKVIDKVMKKLIYSYQNKLGAEIR